MFCVLKLSIMPHLFRIHPFPTHEFPFSASSFLNILKTTCLTSSPKRILDLQFDKCLLLYVQFWIPDDGRKDRPKHVECHFKIK